MYATRLDALRLCFVLESAECGSAVVVGAVDEDDAAVLEELEQFHPDVGLLGVRGYGPKERAVQVLREHDTCMQSELVYANEANYSLSLSTANVMRYYLTRCSLGR